MTTATKSLPPHGSYARGNGCPGYRPPCYCEPCVIAKRKARKRSKVNRQLGRSAFIDAGLAREHVTLLHESMSWNSISSATGVDDRSLCLIHNGRRTRIARTTHAKIMAVAVPTTVDAWVYVDATGTIRRLRALMAIGHSGRVIAGHADTSQARVHRIASGVQPTVRRSLADRIAQAYQQLAYRPAPQNRFTARVRNDAARKKWHSPIAWDLATIDDPAAKPDEADAWAPLHPNSYDPYRRSEIEHLLRFGASSEEIHKRTGASPSYIRQIDSEMRAGQRRRPLKRDLEQEEAA